MLPDGLDEDGRWGLNKVHFRGTRRARADSTNVLMRTLSASIAGATLTVLAACSLVAGCKGSATSSSNTTFGDDDDQGVGSSGGSGSGGGAGSSSGGGSASSEPPTMPSADYADGGIACGPQAGCATSQQCCYGGAPAVEAGAFGPGGFGGVGAPTMTCTSAGSCTGSSLSCSSSQHCSGGQVCCFAYQESEAGASGGPGGAFGGFGAPMTFGAECAGDCPTGDMVHYQPVLPPPSVRAASLASPAPTRRIAPTWAARLPAVRRIPRDRRIPRTSTTAAPIDAIGAADVRERPLAGTPNGTSSGREHLRSSARIRLFLA